MTSDMQPFSDLLPGGIKPVGPNEIGKANSHRIKPPNGVSVQEWIQVIEFAVLHYRATAAVGIPDKASLRAYDFDDTVSKKAWDLIFDYDHNRSTFLEALAIRGVVPLGRGLTARQTLALDILTDPSVTGTWNTRLRKAGLTETQLSAWMEHETFAEQFKTLAQIRMNRAQSAVDVVLTNKALSGEMDAVKYFDKRVGRDPDKKQEMDGRKVVGIIMDALSKHLLSSRRCTCGSEHDPTRCQAMSGPEMLRTIAAEIEVRMKLDGN